MPREAMALPRFGGRLPLAPPARRDEDERARLTRVSPGREGETFGAPPTLRDLLAPGPSMSDKLRATLRHEPRLLERALRKAHYQRSRRRDAEADRALEEFLASGYLITGDVRFFNEFLWRPPRQAARVRGVCLSEFHARLDGEGFHPSGTVTRDRARAHLSGLCGVPAHRSGGRVASPLRIALLGLPGLLVPLRRALLERGHDVSVFSVPHYRDRLRRILVESRVLSYAFNRYHGCDFGYETIPFDRSNEALGGALRKGGFDLGFHRLGFIIRPPVIDAFRRGLLNDHWGVLPYVRGRSTLAWSLLFGFPVAATMHFVDRGVDTGPIVSAHDYDDRIKSAASVGQVRKIVRAAALERILEAFERVGDPSFSTTENPEDAGRQFFSMHDELTAFVDRRLREGAPERRAAASR